MAQRAVDKDLPRSGDVLEMTREASVQFSKPMRFRVIRVLDWPTYTGWVWLDGYQLNDDGDAVDRRSIFVQVDGLRYVSRADRDARAPPLTLADRWFRLRAGPRARNIGGASPHTPPPAGPRPLGGPAHDLQPSLASARPAADLGGRDCVRRRGVVGMLLAGAVPPQREPATPGDTVAASRVTQRTGRPRPGEEQRTFARSLVASGAVASCSPSRAW